MIQQVYSTYHKHVISRLWGCIQEPVRALHKHVLLMSLKHFNYECASCQRVHLYPGCRTVLRFSALVATSHSSPCPGPVLWAWCLGKPQLCIHEARTRTLPYEILMLCDFQFSGKIPCDCHTPSRCPCTKAFMPQPLLVTGSQVECLCPSPPAESTQDQGPPFAKLLSFGVWFLGPPVCEIG